MDLWRAELRGGRFGVGERPWWEVSSWEVDNLLYVMLVSVEGVVKVAQGFQQSPVRVVAKMHVTLLYDRVLLENVVARVNGA